MNDEHPWMRQMRSHRDRLDMRKRPRTRPGSPGPAGQSGLVVFDGMKDGEVKALLNKKFRCRD